MQSALRITTKVLPGNRIEIQLPSGSEGDDIEVFVILPEKPQLKRQNILTFLEDIHQHGPFRTVDEIDADLRAERDSWDD